MAHLSMFSGQVNAIRDHMNGLAAPIDGHNLTVASVIAVSRYGRPAVLDASEERKKAIDGAVGLVQRLAKSLGESSMYGVTTGFGGSATTRTEETTALQQALLVTCQAGVLPIFPTPKLSGSAFSQAARDEHDLMFPQDWIRGVMFVRLNSLIRAQSGVRWVVIDSLHTLLSNGVAPCVPLRQSVSASGDLGPLAYISSVITGNPDTWAHYGEGENRKIVNSATLLKELKMDPVVYIAKEGLSLVNGTGASAAVSSFAMHDSHVLAIASQVLSAFAVESLRGSKEPFHPYLHDATRPHPGQIEVAANIRHTELRQDRYSLRAVPQWLGPQLEDLSSAQATIDIELNSTTDNPITEVETGTLHHGANFMAMSVTSATEKMRLALQHIARLSFAQLTELLNHDTNRGLPPSLAWGEPSVDYSLKGADIAAAAYLSEIAFLANPVSTHVNSAEMHNQCINSLALISARYTLDTIQIVRMLFATQIFAIDLICTYTVSTFPQYVSATDDAFFAGLYDGLVRQLTTTTGKDSSTRFQGVMTNLTSTLISLFGAMNPPAEVPLASISTWSAALAFHAQRIFVETRESYVPGPSSPAMELLGRTRALYAYVRGELGVAVHHGDPTKDSTLIGTEISKIYHAFSTYKMTEVLLSVLEKE
ncbi:L-Aspartase-like protein [Mycena sp. CBHHK59/15]|nr:L-Aspartase-like protein [Mycena sp. CBHHK59/15]